MSASFFPPGWALDVPNPGYGEIFIAADRNPFQGEPLVAEDWTDTLVGPEIGVFVAKITTRAFEPDTDDSATDLPSFVTPAAARQLLPALIRAVALAVGGTDRFERTFHDESEPPDNPLCERCGLGTYFTPGALPSKYCEEYGHQPYGYGGNVTWDRAQQSYQWAKERWDRRKQLERDLEDIRAGKRPCERCGRDTQWGDIVNQPGKRARVHTATGSIDCEQGAQQ